MLTEIFNTDNWTAATLDWISNDLRTRDIEPITHTIHNWRNTSKALSPLDVYKFLKARFGIANGMSMLFKSESSDNLIHWHYTILSKNSVLHFLGNNGGLEISLRIQNSIPFKENDWTLLFDNIKGSFSKYGKGMNYVHSEFEKWTLFINPYTRLHDTLRDLANELRKLTHSLTTKMFSSLLWTLTQRLTQHSLTRQTMHFAIFST